MVGWLNDHLSGKLLLEKIEIETFVNQLIDRCYEDIFFFAKYVLGFDKMVKRTHGRWAKALYQAMTVYDYLMFLKPRKTYKCLEKGTNLLGIGIELDKEYFKIAKKRIKNSKQEYKLFEEVS